MAITATQVKELRQRTNAGMMECKKALVKADGDMEAAIELMRKGGKAKVDKKATRTAAEGLVAIKTDPARKTAAMVEINCETDFVTKDASFSRFANTVAECVLRNQPTNLETLFALPLYSEKEQTVEQRRQELVIKVGENINVRRFSLLHSAEATLATYLHGNHKIGVIVEIEGGNSELGRDLAMQAAAMKPQFLSETEVPAELISKERKIIEAQVAESGKPPEIIKKMVEGRLRKHLSEITLLGQKFVKDDKLSVAKLLQKEKAQLHTFERMEVGEGIEKKADNFAEEVMAQARAA